MKRRTFLSLPIAGAAAARTSPEQPLVLGVIADPQYADREAWNTRHYRASLGKLTAAISKLNAARPDAVVTLGDFIDTGFASFAAVMARYSKLQAKHLKVLGNHDFDLAPDQRDEVLGALGMDRPYSSHVFGNWRVALLDGTEVSTYRPDHAGAAAAWMRRLEQEKRPHAHPWNAAIGGAQLEWLEGELHAATGENQRVLICCHYPVLPANPHNLWNDRELVALVDRFPCVAAWFNGHNHSGNYASRNQCHYVNFKGMVETPDHSAFAIARLFSDRIEIEGFDTEPDRNLRANRPPPAG